MIKFASHQRGNCDMTRTPSKPLRLMDANEFRKYVDTVRDPLTTTDLETEFERRLKQLQAEHDVLLERVKNCA